MTHIETGLPSFIAGRKRHFRAVAFAWYGMRNGELVNPRWKDVDFEARMIHIRVRQDSMPKGSRDRAIPMHPKVEAALRSRAVGEFVFDVTEMDSIKAMDEAVRKLAAS